MQLASSISHRIRIAVCVFLLTAAMLPAQSSSKFPMVAVMPLASEDAGGSAAAVVTDALADELLKTGQVRVMERAQMESILKEQGFSQSGACDGSECAVQVGKILSIDRVIVGSLGLIGNSWSLSVRVVDVTTGEVLGSSRRQQKGEIDEVTTGIVPSVAQELSRTLSAFRSPSSDRISATAEMAPAAEASGDSLAPSSEPERKRVLWPWIVGGALAVGGGVAAAVLLVGGESSSATGPRTDGTESDGSWDTTVRWK